MYDINFFQSLCTESRLGEVKGIPTQVSGGLLHKMYLLETNEGKYAIKMLNPQIMKRPEAMANYVNSERIAYFVSRKMPVVPAKEIQGDFIQKIGAQFYIVYDWIDGETLNVNAITARHSEKIGSLLAEIHGTDFSKLRIIEELENKGLSADWQFYIRKGQQAGSAWVDSLVPMVNELYEWNSSANKAKQLLSANLVISHRDLDPKNVLWNESNPVLIDWESAGYINPMHDLIETAIYWSQDETGNVDKDIFFSFINGYKKSGGEIQADWKTVLATGFSGKLDWLEYNLKRSLWVECTDENEQKLGTAQAVGTIKEIKDYAEKTSILADWLKDVN